MMKGRLPWILGGVAIVLVAAALFAWRELNPRESTDDAQVSGHVSPIAARVGGTVESVAVNDNQQVKTGDVLVGIDPHDYQLAVAKAEADLAAAEAAASVAQTTVPVTSTTTSSQLDVARTGTTNAEAALQAAEKEVDASRAKLASAKSRLNEVTANATKASQDLARLQPLVEKDEVSKQQFDAAKAADQFARAAVESAQSAINEAQANLDVSDAKRQQAAGMVTEAKAQATAAATGPQQVAMTQAKAKAADAEVLQMRAALDQAKLNLDRATVRAATNGVVSRKSVEIGQIIQPGQPLMALTALNDVWVVANFKETQLDGMHIGLHADVSVDAYSHHYSGHVDSISAATGATFSLLPPDNASGNFVKVVQRVPVKILIDSGQNAADVLRPGMSVNATVYLK
jgi:membrane fusion protein (multidrug efflux system)